MGDFPYIESETKVCVDIVLFSLKFLKIKDSLNNTIIQQYNNTFYWNKITRYTIGTATKIQMAWLTGLQIIW